MAKIDVSKVAEILKKNQVDPALLRRVIEEMNLAVEPEGAEGDKPPAVKKQFVIVVSDPEGRLPKNDFVGWVVQIPDSESPATTLDRVFRSAYDYNTTKKGRLLPVKTVGEAIEAIPAKFFKEAELWFPVFRAARFPAFALLGLGVALLSGCDARSAAPVAAASPPASPAAAGPVPISTYEIVATYPHDRTAFTQGLIYLKGIFLESTGLNGSSSLRKVDPQSGSVLQLTRVPAQYFAEGMTVLGDKIYQLTWQNQKGFIYDLARFEQTGEFTYTGEGWGLTTDGTSLILSDGTHVV
eukprot:gene35563-47819_t